MLFARVFWSCSVFARQQYWRARGDGDSHAPTCTRGRSSFANKRIERAGNQQTERACDVTLYPSGNNTNRAAHVNFLLPFIWRLRWKSFIAPKSALMPKPAGSGGKSWKSHCLLFFRCGSVNSSNQTVSSLSIVNIKGQLQVQPGQVVSPWQGCRTRSQNENLESPLRIHRSTPREPL